MTKQEIINVFYTYDEATLQKLYILAECNLVPQQDSLLAVDFATIIDSVFKTGGLADTYYPEWTDRSSGDFGRFLVELFAVLSDKNFFYINHFSREAHASTAELFRSLLQFAISNNISVSMNDAAEFTSSIVFENGAEYTYPRGSIVLGLTNITGRNFSNKTAFTLAANSSLPEPANNIGFIHGELEEITGAFNGRSIILIKESIIADTVELVVGSDTYTRVDSFSDGTITTKHFKVFINSSGQAEIMFAEAGYGVTPEINATYTVSFFVGGGTTGNLSASVLNKVVSCPGRQILTFTQPEATGGTDLMELEDLRHYVINKQKNNDRMVTNPDVEDIVSELDFVKRVKSQNVSNYIFIYVVTTAGTSLSPSQVTAIETHISDKILMGYSALISDPPSVQIYMEVEIYVLPSIQSASAEALADEIIKNYLMANRNGEFGEGVKRGKLGTLLLSGIVNSQNVVFTALNEGTTLSGSPNDISVEPNEVIDYTNSAIIISVIGGESA